MLITLTVERVRDGARSECTVRDITLTGATAGVWPCWWCPEGWRIVGARPAS